MARKASAVGGPSPKMPKIPAPAAPKMAGGKPMTSTKAKAILSDGETRGTPLTKPQKGLFGAIAGGSAPKARAPQMAIGQRPTLGARTRNAMMSKVKSRT
jgi:hypothetical protein